MKKIYFSLLVICMFLAKSFGSNQSELHSRFTLCPEAEKTGWRQHLVKFKFNYMTNILVYESLDPDEWWSEEKPMWGIQYEMGLGKKSSVGFNVGGGSIENLLGVKQPLKLLGEMWYKFRWSGEKFKEFGILFPPEGAFVIYGFPPLLLEILSASTTGFFHYSVGFRFPLLKGFLFSPAGFFGISLNYKGVGLSAEYTATTTDTFFMPLTSRPEKGGLFVGGINFVLNTRSIINLRYIRLSYADNEERSQKNFATYSERYGTDLILLFK